MHEAINAYGDFLAHPHVAAADTMAWLAQPHVTEPVPMANIIGLPPLQSGTARATAPGLGQHSGEILRAHGFGEDRIAALAAEGIVRLG